MRVFIAIDLDEEIQAGLDDLQKRLQAEVDIKKSDVKWVRPELVHLTLKFLGNIEENQVYVFLRKHCDYEELQSFTEREMRDVIRNALKPEFKFPLSAEKLERWGLVSVRISPRCSH